MKRRSTAHVRYGFTLVEALVTAAVIVLLVGLLLPAVQAAREVARRAGCVSNLRQLGTALATYESNVGVYPPNYLEVPYGPDPGKTVNNTSAFVRLLPHLDQANLYASINLDLHPFDRPDAPIVENHTARVTVLGVLLCPSDGEPNHRNSYRFNCGRGRMNDRSLPYDGPFSLGFVPSTSSISDGLSWTAFVSERIGGTYDRTKPDPARDMKLPAEPFGHGDTHDDEPFIEYCVAAVAKGWQVDGGRYWYYYEANYTAYNHNGSPNDSRPTCGGHVFGLLPPRSRHSGLVNVLFGDGHVEAITNSVNQQVWWSMGSAASED